MERMYNVSDGIRGKTGCESSFLEEKDAVFHPGPQQFESASEP